MRKIKNHSQHSDTPIISGRLRDDAWGDDSSAIPHPQLTPFCDVEALHFIGASARSTMLDDRSEEADRRMSSNVKAFVERILAFKEFGTTTEVLETVVKHSGANR